MRESKFLKQGDVGNGVLWTVHGVERVNVAKEGAEPEYKWAMNFAESDKPLVLNSINIQLCEKIFNSDDTDAWVSKKVVLYTDPTISFQGKVTGGIRVRAPRNQGVPISAPAPAPVAVAAPVTSTLDDSDIPFAWLMPLVLPTMGLLSAGLLA